MDRSVDSIKDYSTTFRRLFVLTFGYQWGAGADYRHAEPVRPVEPAPPASPPSSPEPERKKKIKKKGRGGDL